MLTSEQLQNQLVNVVVVSRFTYDSHNRVIDRVFDQGVPLVFVPLLLNMVSNRNDA